MSDLYEDIKDIASETVQWLGKPIILVKRFLDPSWVKLTRAIPRGVQTYWRHKVTLVEVLTDPTKLIEYKGFAVEGKYKGSFYPGLTISAGDIRLYAVQVPRPSEGDSIIVGGIKRTVISCAPIEPGTVALMHDLQVR